MRLESLRRPSTGVGLAALQARSSTAVLVALALAQGFHTCPRPSPSHKRICQPRTRQEARNQWRFHTAVGVAAAVVVVVVAGEEAAWAA